ncbi:hypothetical protein DVH05_027597 [Phytophthora capsici]|nr:hypothetical protein DVH05_027597 [Phytophthora capsici]
MAKLVEVRNAVAQLEQSNGFQDRTASLETAMASSMAMENTLANQVGKIAMGVGTGHVGVKRERTSVHQEVPTGLQEAAQNEALPVSNSDSELDSESSSDSEMESEDEDEIGGSEAALKALMKSQQESKQDPTPKKEDTIGVAVDNSKSAVTRTRLPAAHLKPIVQEVDALPRKDRILITPDILLALKDSVLGDVDGKQRFEVVNSLKFVVKWASDSTGQVQYASSYRAYAEAVTVYVDNIPVSSEQMTEIDRLINELNCKLQRFSEGTNASSSTGVAERCSALRMCVHQIDQLPYSKHRQQMLRLLVSFKVEAFQPLTNSRNRRVIRAATIASRWMRDAPRDPELLCLYALLVDVIRKLVTGEDLVLTDRMLELIAETPSNRAQDFLTSIKNRAVKLLKEVEQLDTCTATEIEGMLNSFRTIVNHVTLGWVSHEDPTVRKCAEILKGRIKKLKRTKHRTRCYQVLNTIISDPKTLENQAAQRKPKKKKKRQRKYHFN